MEYLAQVQGTEWGTALLGKSGKTKSFYKQTFKKLSLCNHEREPHMTSFPRTGCVVIQRGFSVCMWLIWAKCNTFLVPPGLISKVLLSKSPGLICHDAKSKDTAWKKPWVSVYFFSWHFYFNCNVMNYELKLQFLYLPVTLIVHICLSITKTIYKKHFREKKACEMMQLQCGLMQWKSCNRLTATEMMMNQC